jgi:hypothetical protein
VLGPVYRIQSERRESAGVAIAKHKGTIETLTSREKELRAAAKKEKDTGHRAELEAEAEALGMQIAGSDPPTMPQIIADDVTPEALGMLLDAQGGGASSLPPPRVGFSILLPVATPTACLISMSS